MSFIKHITSSIAARLSSICRSYILSTLSGITYGRINIIIATSSPPETLTFGAPKKTHPNVPEATITVKNPAVWTRLCLNLDLGCAESYMLTDLECSDVTSLATIYIHNRNTIGYGVFLMQLIPRIQRILFLPTNTASNALKNARSHYDTSNVLFEAFLSKDMSYSCPIWAPEGENENESLEAAQQRKVLNIIEKAGIRKEHHVLDIGGGWGFLAIEAVRRTGCRVTVTTLSKEQKALGERKVREAGLQHRIEILLCDYRKSPTVEGGYDRIVSVEMLEHVGKEWMDGYFGAISGLLNKDRGVIVIQGITIINVLHDNRPNLENFIDRYVFPGGYLPSIPRLLDAIHKGSKGSLEVDTVQSIGPHYAKALRLWRENLLANWDVIKEDYRRGRGGDEKDLEAFRRRWVWYFSYCEAGFREGILGDSVVVARRRPSEEERAGVPL